MSKKFLKRVLSLTLVVIFLLPFTRLEAFTNLLLPGDFEMSIRDGKYYVRRTSFPYDESLLVYRRTLEAIPADNNYSVLKDD